MKDAPQPVVYRAFDALGRLLYVGSTTNFRSRMATHRCTSWWTAIAARYEVETYADIDTARRAEKTAIGSEAPAFNHTHNPRRSSRTWPLTESELEAVLDWDRHSTRGLPFSMRWLRNDSAA